MMRTPFSNLLATVACVASVAGYYGSARAGDINTVPHGAAELAQWRSALTDTRGPNADPEWKSTLGAIDPGDPTEFRASHGAIGLRHVTQYGVLYSPRATDDRKRASRSALEPAGTLGGTKGTAR